ARAVTAALVHDGVLSPMDEPGVKDFSGALAAESLARTDRVLRAFSRERLEEDVPERGRELVRSLRRSAISFLEGNGALLAEVPEARWESLEDALAREYAGRFDEWILIGDVTQAMRRVADFLVESRAVEAGPKLWSRPRTFLSPVAETARVVSGRDEQTVF